MSDRELRDEIEVLYGQLKHERAIADAPQDAELAKARTALQNEIAELKERKLALEARRAELDSLKRERQLDTSKARHTLSRARSVISNLQPLGDPLAESRSNWEVQPDANPGCAVGVWVIACVGLSALGWWLT
jgi:hypothetical protein